MFAASDGKSKIHLKCGDTDEVRPAAFTRFSTKLSTFAPFNYELATAKNVHEITNNGVKEFIPNLERFSPSSTRSMTKTFNLMNRFTTLSNKPSKKNKDQTNMNTTLPSKF